MIDYDENFDLTEMANKLKDGFETLQKKRDYLVQRQGEIEEELEKTNKEMAKLHVMLTAYDLTSEKELPHPSEQPIVRVRGVKKALKKLASELTLGVAWGEDQLIEMIQKQIPGAKESSIKDSIRTLGNEDIFNRYINEENIRVCETTIGKPQDKDIAVGDAIKATIKVGTEDGPTVLKTEGMSVEEAKAQEATKKPEQATLPEVIVMGQAEVITAMEKEMKKRKSFPMAEKNIGWIAADLGVDPKTIRDALKVMVTGNWEFAYEGEVKVLRRKADPGSKEELKRTQIEDEPLFPNADRPPFA